MSSILGAGDGDEGAGFGPGGAGAHGGADFVRLDKGRTEGPEPNVTEEIIKLMRAAQ